MRWLEKIRMYIQMLLHRRRETQRLDAELGFHLEQQIAENMAAGMGAEEARYAALRTFGNPALLREQARETWNWNTFELLLQNMRIAIRTLARTPGFALISVLVMAIGIGANVALFTVVRSVLLDPLPFKDPGRLVRLYEYNVSADHQFPYNVVAGGIFSEWKKQSTSFSDMALVKNELQYNLSAAGGQLPERVSAAACSWNLFSTLGVEPALGRGFTADDDRPSATATVVLSWGLWKRRFGGDRSVLGQTIHLDAKPYTVIGVMPAGFAYPEQSVQLWTPAAHDLADRMESVENHQFRPVGRLKPGVTEKQALADLSLIVRRVHDQHLDNPFISNGANIRPLLEAMVGKIEAPLYMLLAATGCVLLIACLNIANLLVARAAARRRELAIRAALGSSRLRLMGEQLTESFILSAAGGAAGLLLASVIIRGLVSTRQDISRVEAIHIDGAVVAFTVGLVFLCAVFAGLISAASATGSGVLSALQESSRSHSGGQARAKLRKMLLSLEVGLTVVLLITAGLLLKSYQRLRSSDLGCVTQNVLTMRFSLPQAQYPQPAQRTEFFDALVTRVRSLPGVRAAGLSTAVPGQGYMEDRGFLIAEHPPLPLGQPQFAISRWVDPAYFATLEIPFLHGQPFQPDQKLDHAMKAIVSESFARRYLPGEDPVGKHLLMFGKKHPYEIAGVVGDTRFLIGQPAEPIIYFPLYTGTETDATLAVRSSQDVNQLALPIQQIVQQLDGELPVADIMTMEQLIGKTTVDAGFDAMLLLAFAVLSLILAAVGLFGVLSYLVTQRSTEIGIRLALGAQRETVLALVLRDGLRPAFAGVALGLIGSVVAAQLVRSMLYGVRPFDPMVFLAVVVVLLLVSGGACIVPAWRASRLDPILALREE